LRAVADGAYANLELPRLLKRSHLQGRDAAFTTELAFGTLRHRSFYDAVIAQAADRPVSAIDDRALDVLRLGVHQLLGMRVPDHAALDQTVGLARAVVSQGSGGFVNAVLRRVSEADREIWLDRVRPVGGGAAALALEHSHPDWIVTAFRGALLSTGFADATSVDHELTSVLAIDNDAPKVALVARPGLATVDELVDSADAARSTTSPIGAVLQGGDPGAVPAVRDGRAAAQDEGSQLLALALAEVPVDDSVTGPERWLDLCAGPGGKSGVLAAIAEQRGIPFVNGSLTIVPNCPPDPAGPGWEVRTGDGRTTVRPGIHPRLGRCPCWGSAPCVGIEARGAANHLATARSLQRDLPVVPSCDRARWVTGYVTCSPHWRSDLRGAGCPQEAG
jgi:16S rRNA (cytosine967-C5)-methyltransferase